jgi:hypothetical protein
MEVNCFYKGVICERASIWRRKERSTKKVSDGAKMMKPLHKLRQVQHCCIILSKPGYEKVLAIVEGDEALRVASGARGSMFGRDLFYISSRLVHS